MFPQGSPKLKTPITMPISKAITWLNCTIPRPCGSRAAYSHDQIIAPHLG